MLEEGQDELVMFSALNSLECIEDSPLKNPNFLGQEIDFWSQKFLIAISPRERFVT